VEIASPRPRCGVGRAAPVVPRLHGRAPSTEAAPLAATLAPCGATGDPLTFRSSRPLGRFPSPPPPRYPVQTTTLGRTGLVVSRLALGCMSYGDPGWRPWVLDESAARPFFRRAVELGINFFDTADMYSLGRSEEVTGKMLRS